VLYSVSDFGSIEEYQFISYSIAGFLAILDGEKSMDDAVAEWAQLSGNSPQKVLDIIGQFAKDNPGILSKSSLLPQLRFSRDEIKEFAQKSNHFPESKEPSERLQAPLSLVYLPVRTCSKNCLYCCLKDGSDAEKIPLSRVKEILLEASKLGIASIAFSGGVPFQREDCWEILEYTVEFGLLPLLCTKSSLPEDILKRLTNLGVRLQIGIDSFNPDTADFIDGSSNSILDMISCAQLFKEAGGVLAAKVPLTSHNIQDVPILVDMLAAADIQRINLSPLCWCQDNDTAGLLPSYKTLGQLGGAIRNIKDKYRELYVSMGKAIVSCAHCSAQTDTLVINPEGKVIACRTSVDQGWEPIVGDVTVQGLLEIWNSDAFRKALVPSRDRFLGLLC